MQQTSPLRRNPITPQPRAVTTNPNPPVQLPNEADIRLRAFEIYQARGQEPGHEVDDWVQAERELSARRGEHR